MQDAGLHRNVRLALDDLMRTASVQAVLANDPRLDDDHGAGFVRAPGKGPLEARASGCSSGATNLTAALVSTVVDPAVTSSPFGADDTRKGEHERARPGRRTPRTYRGVRASWPALMGRSWRQSNS